MYTHNTKVSFLIQFHFIISTQSSRLPILFERWIYNRFGFHRVSLISLITDQPPPLFLLFHMWSIFFLLFSSGNNFPNNSIVCRDNTSSLLRNMYASDITFFFFLFCFFSLSPPLPCILFPAVEGSRACLAFIYRRSFSHCVWNAYANEMKRRNTHFLFWYNAEYILYTCVRPISVTFPSLSFLLFLQFFSHTEEQVAREEMGSQRIQGEREREKESGGHWRWHVVSWAWNHLSPG